MNKGSDMAHEAISARGTDKVTARQAHTTRKRDTRRCRRYCPTVNMVSPKTAALTGPATSSGSHAPKLAVASRSGIERGPRPS